MNHKALYLKKKEKSSIALFKKGKFSEAELNFRDILKINGKNFNSLLYLGRIELLSNNLEYAKELFIKALKIKPRLRGLNNLLGEVYYRLGQYDNASSCYEAAGKIIIAKKLASFNGVSPYQIEGENDISKVKFILSEPLPVIQIKVNKSKSANFFIDTGGAEIILDRQFSKEVGIENFGSETGSFAGGKKAAFYHGKVDSITLGEFTVNNVPIHVMDISSLSEIYFKGIRIDGAIGTNLLYQFLVSIDYNNKQLILRRKNNQILSQFEKEIEDDLCTIVPFWLAGDHYMVAWGRVNSSKPLLFFVDTGLVGGGFICPRSTLNKGKIVLNKNGEEGYTGGGGKINGIPFLIEELSFGNTKQNGIRGIYFKKFPLENAFGFQISGLISQDYFKSYVLTIDFIKMRFFLVQN